MLKYFEIKKAFRYYIKQIDSMLPSFWFRNRSQKMSKCGKIISDTLGYASCATFLFLPHFDVICDLSLNRRTATWNLFVNYRWRHRTARGVGVMIARAKTIYIFVIKVNKSFSFLSSRCFLKEVENVYSVFLSSYRNTRESLGELEKAVETLACGSCSHSISRSPKLPLVFL